LCLQNEDAADPSLLTQQGSFRHLYSRRILYDTLRSEYVARSCIYISGLLITLEAVATQSFCK